MSQLEQKQASSDTGDCKEAMDGLFDAEDRTPTCGFCGYFVACALAIAASSFVTVYFWSSMFIGKDALKWLQDNSMYSYVLFGLSFFLVTTLYLLDFFFPPHLPGLYLTLWKGDRCFGRSILAVALLLFTLGTLFLAESYPNVPMLTSIFMCPGIVAVARVLLRPRTFPHGRPKELENMDIKKKIQFLKRLVGQTQDLDHFFRALLFAFWVNFSICLIAWLCWVVIGGHKLDTEGMSSKEADQEFVLWACPLLVAISNLVFTLGVFFRIRLQRAYLQTNEFRGKLVAEVSQHANDRPAEDAEIARLARLASTGSGAAMDSMASSKSMVQLTIYVKAIFGIFSLFIGLLYGCMVLLWADSHVASMFLGLLFVFFVSFIILMFLSLSRLAVELGKWLLHLPIWAKVSSWLQSDWTRSFFFACLLPFLVVGFILSCVNQCVRRCRGLTRHAASVEGDAVRSSNLTEELSSFVASMTGGLATSQVAPEEAASIRVTARVHLAQRYAETWDWLSLIWKCYTWCLLIFSYYVGSLLFNTLFAWLIKVLSPLDFSVVILLTFIVGVVAFLWPTIPGMVVYMFGGLLIAGTCPIGTSKDEKFWIGASINIVLGFCLKLTACAVQQKIFGETLGKRLTVRHMCGIHTPTMRTIESVLRRPGMTIGKVAILCGGPDWPVSVLCGILKLSLAQCELGTVPIIFYVIPCALTGSMYLRTGDGPEWESAASAMVFLTSLVTGILWVIMAWAIQQEYELKGDVLRRPLPEHADLFWLDHKFAEIEKRCVVRRSEVPASVRRIFTLGAVVQIVMCHGFLWGSSYLLGQFQVSDPIADMEWYSSSLKDSTCQAANTSVERSMCLFNLPGLIVCFLYCIAWAGYYMFKWWRQSRNRQPLSQAMKELDGAAEARWKDDWVQNIGKEPPKAATGNQPGVELDAEGTAQCRSCSNTGVDFMGQPCTCEYGTKAPQPPPSSAVSAKVLDDKARETVATDGVSETL